MDLRKLNCQKICEALSLPARVRQLQESIKAYPNRLTISKLRETMRARLKDNGIHFEGTE